MEYYKPDGTNAYKPTEAKPLEFVGDWVDVHYIIEAKTGQIYMYYNNVLFAKIPMAKSAGTGNYIAGISALKINVDKWGHGQNGKGIYVDDVQVRGMSAEQLNKVFIAGALPAVVPNGYQLPATINGMENITWSCDSATVTVTDGVVSVPNSFYGDVKFIATIDGVANEVVVKAGIAPIYSSIQFGEVYNTVVGSVNVVGDHSITLNGVGINNPLYTYNNTLYAYAWFGDNAHNYVSKTSADGVTKYAVWSNAFIRNESGNKGYGRVRINLDNFTPECSTVWIEIDYLDNFTSGSIRYYDSTETDADASHSVTVTGSNDNKWKTFRIKVEDAKFGTTANTNGEIDLNDLRYVSAVRVYSATAADADGNLVIDVPESKQVKHAVHAVTNDGTGKLYANKEYTADKARNVQVFIAIYDKQGDLKSVVATPEIAFAAGETKTIKTELTPKQFHIWDGDTVGFFVWDADDLTPLE